MPDPTEHFEVLDRLSLPDLWEENRDREPPQPPPGAHGAVRRAVLAATLLAFAAGAVGFAAFAFRERRAPEPATTTPPIRNGEIWARVGGGDGPSYVYSVAPDGSGATLLWGDGRDSNEPPDTVRPGLVGGDYAWSLGGLRIAFAHRVPIGSGVTYEIFTMNADGSNLRQITHDGGIDSGPSWSPDGSRIAYAHAIDTSAPAGCPGSDLCPSDIYVIGADGSGPTRLTAEPADDSSPAWSPDGSRILFQSTRDDRHADIYAMDPDGTNVTDLTPGPGWDSSPEWSPDGTTFAFIRGAFEETFRLCVMGPGGLVTYDTGLDTGAHAVWSPDGSEIAFTAASPRGGSPELFTMDADGSNVRQLTDVGLGVGDLAWRPAPAG